VLFASGIKRFRPLIRSRQPYGANMKVNTCNMVVGIGQCRSYASVVLAFVSRKTSGNCHLTMQAAMRGISIDIQLPSTQSTHLIPLVL
jgi:hypothetical protein